jgi:transposase
MRTRTARLNTLRGVLRELGVNIPPGARLVLPRLSNTLSDPEGPIPESLHPVLLSIASEIRTLEQNIKQVDRQLERLARSLPAALSLQPVPGIGLLTSTALIASVGDPSRFGSGRRLASCLGLVPREHSSGSSRHLGSITKRGDCYLRTLLTHGARAVLWAARHYANPDALRCWALAVQKRRGHNRAAIALANKLARIAWAVWSKNTTYQPRAAEAFSQGKADSPSTNARESINDEHLGPTDTGTSR